MSTNWKLHLQELLHDFDQSCSETTAILVSQINITDFNSPQFVIKKTKIYCSCDHFVLIELKCCGIYIYSNNFWRKSLGILSWLLLYLQEPLLSSSEEFDINTEFKLWYCRVVYVFIFHSTLSLLHTIWRDHLIFVSTFVSYFYVIKLYFHVNDMSQEVKVYRNWKGWILELLFHVSLMWLWVYGCWNFTIDASNWVGQFIFKIHSVHNVKFDIIEETTW